MNRGLQLAEQITDPLEVESLPLRAHDPLNILEILGATRQDLGDDELLRADHGDDETTNVDRARRTNELFLQARAPENGIECEATRVMREREHPGPGNEILDVAFPDGIADSARMEARLDAIPGIVETGLFVGLAHVLIVGHDDGHIERRER